MFYVECPRQNLSFYHYRSSVFTITSFKENLIQAIRPTQIQAIRVRTNTMMYLYSLLLLTSIPTTLASVMVLDSRGNVEMVDQEYDARYNSLRVNAMTYRGVWGVVTEDAKINYDLVLKGMYKYLFILPRKRQSNILFVFS